MTNEDNQKPLGTFAITMINIMAVCSLRLLPFSAEYGFALISYFMIAGLCFFIPIALISAELATGWPSRGGAYVWVKEAFGDSWAFLTIWMQWLFNLFWFPTMLVFIVETAATIFMPNWSLHPGAILTTVLVLFWWATFMNFFGMRLSAAFSTFSAIVGTLTPMIIMIGLGALWLAQGNPSQIEFTWQNLLPQKEHLPNLAFFTTILFGLLGIEMSAVHADEVIHPGKTYPNAIFASTIIILSSLILSSLAIAVVVPINELNVINGINQALAMMLNNSKLAYLLPCIGLMIILSGLGNVSAWIIGPTKGVLMAARDGHLPQSWQHTNRHNAPCNILLFQAVIFTFLCGIFVLMPSIETGYWVLTAMTAQMALSYYVIVFAAGIALRYQQPLAPRSFRIPGGNLGISLVGSLGIISCIIAIILGFAPPQNLGVANLAQYQIILCLGIVAMLVPPLFVFRRRRKQIGTQT